MATRGLPSLLLLLVAHGALAAPAGEPSPPPLPPPFAGERPPPGFTPPPAVLTPDRIFSARTIAERPELVLELYDGSVLVGRLIGQSEATLDLELTPSTTVRIPRDRIERLRRAGPEASRSTPEAELSEAEPPAPEEVGPPRDRTRHLFASSAQMLRAGEVVAGLGLGFSDLEAGLNDHTSLLIGYQPFAMIADARFGLLSLKFGLPVGSHFHLAAALNAGSLIGGPRPVVGLAGSALVTLVGENHQLTLVVAAGITSPGTAQPFLAFTVAGTQRVHSIFALVEELTLTTTWTAIDGAMALAGLRFTPGGWVIDVGGGVAALNGAIALAPCLRVGRGFR